MELYIRSQDRLILEKYETLQLCQNPDGTWFFNSGLVLGKYKTKERALEVLDEIQKILMPMISYKPITKVKMDSVKDLSLPYVETIQVGGNEEIHELSTYVYEMPQE